MPVLLLPLIIFGLCGPLTQRVLAPSDEDLAMICLYRDGVVGDCHLSEPGAIIEFEIGIPECGQSWYATAWDHAGNESEKSRKAIAVCADMDRNGWPGNYDLLLLHLAYQGEVR